MPDIFVQHGSITLEGTDTSDTYTLDEPVHVDHSFVIGTVRGDTANINHLATAKLTGIVDDHYTEVEVERSTDSGTTVCEFQVITSSAIHIKRVISRNTEGSSPSVDLPANERPKSDKALLVSMSRLHANDAYTTQNGLFAWWLTGLTTANGDEVYSTFEGARGAAGGTIRSEGYILEWDGAESLVMPDGWQRIFETELTYTLPGTVEPEKTLIVPSFHEWWWLDDQPDHAMVMQELLSEDEIRVTREADTEDIPTRAQVLSHPDFKVQRGTASGTGTTATVAIDEVDLDHAFLMANQYGNAKSDSNDDITNASVTHKFNSSTEIEFERGTDDGEFTVAWQVVEFEEVEPEPERTVRSSVGRVFARVQTSAYGLRRFGSFLNPVRFSVRASPAVRIKSGVRAILARARREASAVFRVGSHILQVVSSARARLSAARGVRSYLSRAISNARRVGVDVERLTSFIRVAVTKTSASRAGIRRATSFIRVLWFKVQRSGLAIRNVKSILIPVVFNARAKPKVAVVSFIGRINTAATGTAAAFRYAASAVRRFMFRTQSIVPGLREVTSSVHAVVFNAERGAEVSRRVASFIGAVLFKVRSWPRVRAAGLIRNINAAAERAGAGERRVIFLMGRVISRASGALLGIRSVSSSHARVLFNAFGLMQAVRTVGSGVRRVVFRAFTVIPDVRAVRFYVRRIAATATRGARSSRRVSSLLNRILFTAATVPVIFRVVTSYMHRTALEVDVRRVKKVVVKSACRIVISGAFRVGLGLRRLEMRVRKIELALRGRIAGERRVRSWQRPFFFGLRTARRGVKSVASFLRRLIFKGIPAVEPPFIKPPLHAIVEDSRTKALIDNPKEGVMIKVHIKNTGS